MPGVLAKGAPQQQGVGEGAADSIRDGPLLAHQVTARHPCCMGSRGGRAPGNTMVSPASVCNVQNLTKHLRTSQHQRRRKQVEDHMDANGYGADTVTCSPVMANLSACAGWEAAMHEADAEDATSDEESVRLR